MNKRERISDFLRSLEPASPEASSQDYYAAFFQLWNAQKYYEAHDVLEQLWLVEKNAELARFYQALIQAAGRLFICRKTSSNHRMPSMDVDCVRPSLVRIGTAKFGRFGE